MQYHQKPLQLLGGLCPDQFLTDYWQKKPLLIKQAIPSFRGLLSPEELAGLACEDDAQARIVQQSGQTWHLKNGPFDDEDFANLPENTNCAHWTLLVQSVNHFLPEARELLQQFNFIPDARLDDLMVSYAPDGGSVGPHFDSYDVFLLQGQGQRLWKISEQSDLSLIDNAPLKILKNFVTEQEWLLEAGDMLYLPPHVAHWGIAKTFNAKDCMTYSIGFRAPSNQELAHEFLGFLQDRLTQQPIMLEGMYQDTDLTLQTNCAEINIAMIKKVGHTLQKIQWDNSTIAQFLGCYLSEPKSHIIFHPNKNIKRATFIERFKQHGLILDLKTQFLFSNNDFFMNGEHFKNTFHATTILKNLANNKLIEGQSLEDNSLIEQLYAWYLAGYCHLNTMTP